MSNISFLILFYYLKWINIFDKLSQQLKSNLSFLIANCMTNVRCSKIILAFLKYVPTCTHGRFLIERKFISLFFDEKKKFSSLFLFSSVAIDRITIGRKIDRNFFLRFIDFFCNSSKLFYHKLIEHLLWMQSQEMKEQTYEEGLGQLVKWSLILIKYNYC